MSDTDNVFGGEDNDFDISDEGLDARGWEEDATHNDPSLEVDHDDSDDEDDDLEVVEESDDNAVDDAGPQYSMPDKLKGKTAEELAEIYSNLESLSSKQQSELRDQIRSLQEQNNQFQQYIMNQQGGPSDKNAIEEFLDYAVVNPTDAYNEILGHFNNGTASKELVEAVIDEVYEVDPKLARQMDRHFMTSLSEDIANERTSHLNQSHQINLLAGATNDLANRFPDSVNYAAEIGEIANAYPQLFGNMSAEELNNGLMAAYQMAVGQNPTKTAAYREKFNNDLRSEKMNSQVEKGSAGEKHEAPLTEEDRVRNEIFGRTDPAVNIFEDLIG